MYCTLISSKLLKFLLVLFNLVKKLFISNVDCSYISHCELVNGGMAKW